MNKIELLAPGGDVDSIKSAIVAGADAVYCGLDRFNARNRAANISFDDFLGVIKLAHKNSCQIFLTLNIILLESEFSSLITLLNRVVNSGVDGVIIQDFGLFSILSNHYPTLKIHASTQLTTHNRGQTQFLKKLNTTRVNLSRELNISEIKTLTKLAHKNDIFTEVFVHGSNCISFSGLCYMSSLSSGNSGNRGRCSQPCRDEYIKTQMGIQFPLNIKDNSAFLNLDELADAKVDSLKIEGRIKKFHYVFTIVDSWRKQLDYFYEKSGLKVDKERLYTVFNRDFSNTFLTGKISKDLFTDNPRDHSAIHLAQKNSSTLDEAKKEIYDSRTEIIREVESKIKRLSIEKEPVTIVVFGKESSPLKMIVKTEEVEFELSSQSNLKNVTSQNTKNIVHLNSISKRLKPVNETSFFIKEINLDNLNSSLTLPFKEFTQIRNRVLYLLNGSIKLEPPFQLKKETKEQSTPTTPSLSILINSLSDLNLSTNSNSQLYFELPSSLDGKVDFYLNLFKENSNLTAWFPSLIMESDYKIAVEFLKQLNPSQIVTNNTGIAFETDKLGIDWIAGPYLNLTNSYALETLKNDFNCRGAFISNEINRQQINKIRKPDNFKLFYSIYHPITLMTSRQCFFHQVTGCHKKEMDESCISECNKASSIKNLKDEMIIVNKSEGNFNSLYSEFNFLNLDIIQHLPNRFESFLVDFREIKTSTQLTINKNMLIKLFEKAVLGDIESTETIKKTILEVTSVQYERGL
jgi:putative protease